MGTALSISLVSPQKIEWMAVWMIKRKRRANFGKLSGIAQKKKIMSGEYAEKWPWRNDPQMLLFIAFIIYIIAFIVSLESLSKMWAWKF